MLVQITLVITLILYAVIASQAFMYMLALKSVQLNLDAAAYITLRKLIDASMMASIKYVMYGALASNILLVVLLIGSPDSLIVSAAIFSCIMLVADMLIAVKGNLPINALINSWSTDQYPSNWFEYRNRWLKFFRYRQLVIITGFVVLVIGTVFS